MPTEAQFESLAERRIREGIERGEFDGLQGAGRPLPDLDDGYDPAWWAKRFVARERLCDEGRELAERIRRFQRRAAAGDDTGAIIAELQTALDVVNRELPEDLRVRP